ncbi:hypothetical protein J1605_006622 [Eschrichtius robustus]|uniref:Uncharacterized protein n=1 Tax=Eschrichtius robustus TaxID=9764 RepID=A0AB34H3M9_ESCRO|nr:hypothetical protein J1605_006622 [Eschrichtius robustus]
MVLKLWKDLSDKPPNDYRVKVTSLAHYVDINQDKEQELEQLTKELRQVNLQQFIQQTGTKVTVLPAEPIEVEASHADLERGTIPVGVSEATWVLSAAPQ